MSERAEYESRPEWVKRLHESKVEWLKRLFEGIEDGSGTAGDGTLLWYESTLRGTVGSYFLWLNALHHVLGKPWGPVTLASDGPCEVVGPAFSLSKRAAWLGWTTKAFVSRAAPASEQDALLMAFTANPRGGDRFRLHAVSVTSYWFVRRFVELVFYSVHSRCLDPMQAFRVGLWRSAVENMIEEWTKRPGDEDRRTGRKRPLEPYQREAVEEWKKLVNAGDAPLQQFFARKHKVTDRTLRNWMAKYREGEEGLDNQA